MPLTQPSQVDGRPVERLATPPVPLKSNCLLWALAMLHTQGGSITWRWSHNIPFFPHWIWVDPRGYRWSYSPRWPHRVPWDLLWFRGGVIPE